MWVRVPPGSLEVASCRWSVVRGEVNELLRWLRGEGGGLQTRSAWHRAGSNPVLSFSLGEVGDALLAQLAERLFRKQEVRSSKLRWGPFFVPVVQLAEYCAASAEVASSRLAGHFQGSWFVFRGPCVVIRYRSRGVIGKRGGLKIRPMRVRILPGACDCQSFSTWKSKSE